MEGPKNVWNRDRGKPKYVADDYVRQIVIRFPNLGRTDWPVEKLDELE
jgi:hypothetical protein